MNLGVPRFQMNLKASKKAKNKLKEQAAIVGVKATNLKDWQRAAGGLDVAKKLLTEALIKGNRLGKLL